MALSRRERRHEQTRQEIKQIAHQQMAQQGAAPLSLRGFASLLFGTKDFPHSDVPMQKIVDRVADGTYKARPVKVFSFEHIPDAHRLMEANGANGKIVVVR